MHEIMSLKSPRSTPEKENAFETPSLSESEEISLNAPEYMTDEFRMKHFKIDKCPKLHAHDWTTCPLAHDGEKARRRDPEQYKYAAIACIDMKNNGHCPRGDDCPYAHNVFEYWMHPTRYRTQVCNDGMKCKRQICFFAHRLEELRIPPRKPGFPPEWNKGRKHKNRNANAKKKSTTRNETSRKGNSEPVNTLSSSRHNHVDQTNTLKNPLPSTTCSGSVHRLTFDKANQSAGSAKHQQDAVHSMPISSAAGHNFCHFGINQLFTDQHLAVQSDSQSSTGLQFVASNLERALCRSGVEYGFNQTEQKSGEEDYSHSQCGGVFGVDRMNTDLLLEVSKGIDAFSVSMPSGSTLSSPQGSQIHSPQKFAPFPGMGSDLGSPYTPQSSKFSPLRLENTLYNYRPYVDQRFIIPEYQQPFAY